MFLSDNPVDFNFNPRSREGERHNNVGSTNLIDNFNPRSREGSDAVCGTSSNVVSDFNPRSREGSDEIPEETAYTKTISIRAPARGATGILAILNRHYG